ncbi:MAG TPA: M3 family metallopeptidase, partial [Anaerolineae bacterium]|nr:M3 family metallopeptidase [Anaerolineae bacterium]
VYQYATGIAGAHALAKRILSGEKGAANDYINFLKAGDSMYSLDALRLAGVDLSKPQAVDAAFAVLSGMVDKLESLLG